MSIAIAYDNFFREESKLVNENQVVNTELSEFAEFTLKLSNEFPILYGAFAIILAIVLGVLVSVSRKILSPIIRKLFSNFKKSSVKKTEEVKFPEK